MLFKADWEGARSSSTDAAVEMMMTASQPSVRIAPSVLVLVGRVKPTSCRRDLSFGLCEYYISIFDDEASRENLRDEPADLLGRDVRDAENLPTHRLLCSVETGELRAGRLDSECHRGLSRACRPVSSRLETPPPGQRSLLGSQLV